MQKFDYFEKKVRFIQEFSKLYENFIYLQIFVVFNLVILKFI